MNCDICRKQRIKADGSPGGFDCPGVCNHCRSAAELGLAIMAQPMGFAIAFDPETKLWRVYRTKGKPPNGMATDPILAMMRAGLL